MRLLINNLTNANNVTVPNESASFPKENIFSQALIDKCYVESSIDIDFGTAISANSFSLFWTGEANITLIGSSTEGGNDFELTVTRNVYFFDIDGDGEPNTFNLITGQGDQLITGQGDNITVQSAFNRSFRYWRIEVDTPIYVNYLYLGIYLQFYGHNNYPTPSIANSDQTNITNSGQVYTTIGTPTKAISFDFIISTEAEYTSIMNWYLSDERAKNSVIVPFEDDIDKEIVKPFFSKLSSELEPARDLNTYDYTLSWIEAK